jgi:hypothetical protein
MISSTATGSISPGVVIIPACSKEEARSNWDVRTLHTILVIGMELYYGILALEVNVRLA